MTADNTIPGCDVRVVLAEDSATIRHHLASLINATSGMCVIGEAGDGLEAVATVAHQKPDVVSMDVRMPGMDGLAATRQIMTECPTPVVIVSSLLERDIDLSFQAIEAGALAVVEKPPGRDDPAFASKQRRFLRTLLAMARVSVVRRGSTARLAPPEAERPVKRKLRLAPEVIAIGASAGGPSALSRLLQGLPTDLPVPVVIVQHMPAEFSPGLARWLDKMLPMPVSLIEHGTRLTPGTVHLSPGDAHCIVTREQGVLMARLQHERGTYHYVPAVDVLFESVASTCGAAAIGIVLTGMGNDGARGLTAMHEAGAHTMAQDRHSSTVFGMPRAAIEAGAVQQVLPLVQIATAIRKLL